MGALPAHAHRIRVRDDELRPTLADAGAELVEVAPDVEIAPAAELTGDADWAIVSLSSAPPDGGRRPLRAARRVLASGSVRLAARRAARDVRRRGYDDVTVLGWDLEQRLILKGREPGSPLRLAERLPQRAVVVGRRGAAPSLFDAVVEAAARDGGTPVEPGWPLLRAGILVARAGDAILRVAVGPGRLQIERQLAALADLRAAVGDRALAATVPWPLRSGRTGLADWSLEPLLPGTRPHALGEGLLRECVDFLVDLYGVAGAETPPASPAADAAFVASRLGEERTAGIRALGEEYEARLTGVPRGFGHGDFWTGNLLVDPGGRLTGVIDWDAAGGGRMPLLDLLHLRLNAQRRPAADEWGRAVVAQLVPWAREGGDEVARGYLARIGVELDREALVALVGAYWLDHVAHQLLYIDRDTRPAWLRSNIDLVLNALRREQGRRSARATMDDSSGAHVADWSALAERSGNVFSTPEWASVWLRHLGGGRETDVRLARGPGGEAIALLPLCVSSFAGLRIVRFVGHGPADELGPVCAPEHAAGAAPALAAAVDDLAGDLLVADRLSGRGGRPALGEARLLAREESPVLETAGRTWEDYLAGRSGNFREQVRRRERKLAREHDLRFRLADSPDRLADDFDVLLELHRAHWRRVGARSDFAALHADFHREFATVALERGWLRLWLLEVDGVARAAWYGLRFGGVDSFYQAGRDPAWDRASVGFVLLSHSIREAFRDGMREYRFLRGGESYKYRFADADADAGVETLAVPRTPAGRAIAGVATALGSHRALTRLRARLARVA